MAAASSAKILPQAAAPWKLQLQQSLKQNSSLVYAKYVSLATIRLDGGPSVRTVVFRGFLSDTNDLTFITDERSKKVKEVAANPAVEVSWYFPNTREQYRISGKLSIIGAQCQDASLLAARQRTWDALSDAARSQFAWPHPGLPRDPDGAAFSRPAPGPKQEPLQPFCLMVLQPSEVDYINLFDNVRQAHVRSQDGSWPLDGVDINP